MGTHLLKDEPSSADSMPLNRPWLDFRGPNVIVQPILSYRFAMSIGRLSPLRTGNPEHA
jgi:hypothetical protein